MTTTLQNIDKLSGQAREFALACYDMNTAQDLRAALTEEPDATDCETWGLTSEEWRAACTAAAADIEADGAEK